MTRQPRFCRHSNPPPLPDKRICHTGAERQAYKEYEFTLEKGGTLFLYTDGVAEATDGQNEQFGMDRILEALNREPDAAPHRILETMQSAVENFVGDAPQFDDLTMMALKMI